MSCIMLIVQLFISNYLFLLSRTYQVLEIIVHHSYSYGETSYCLFFSVDFHGVARLYENDDVPTLTGTDPKKTPGLSFFHNYFAMDLRPFLPHSFPHPTLIPHLTTTRWFTISIYMTRIMPSLTLSIDVRHPLNISALAFGTFWRSSWSTRFYRGCNWRTAWIVRRPPRPW